MNRNVKASVALCLLLAGISLVIPPMKYQVDYLDFSKGASETIGSVIILAPFWNRDPDSGIRVSSMPIPRRISQDGAVVTVKSIDDKPAGVFAFGIWIVFEILPIAILGFWLALRKKTPKMRISA